MPLINQVTTLGDGLLGPMMHSYLNMSLILPIDGPLILIETGANFTSNLVVVAVTPTLLTASHLYILWLSVGLTVNE